MNKKRLLKLADFLETVVPAKKFDLETWVRKDPELDTDEIVEGSCGFSGCAVGWAAHAKLFPGFKLPKVTEVESHNGRVVRHVNRSPVYKQYTGFDAVSELFGIDHADAFHLFVDSHYPNFRATPKQVAKRIRQFVENDGMVE